MKKSITLITKDQIKELKETNTDLLLDICMEHGQEWQWINKDAYEYACECA